MAPGSISGIDSDMNRNLKPQDNTKIPASTQISDANPLSQHL